MSIDINAVYARFRELINKFGERAEPLNRMYDAFGQQLKDAPASSKTHHHLAEAGGYLDHVVRVHDTAMSLMKFFAHKGGILNATEEEVAFAALHHDLGKLGVPGKPFYVKEEDAYWLRKGYEYKCEDYDQVLTVYDRSLWLLNQYGVKFSVNEMLGIRMADGMFEPANEKYFLAKGNFPHGSYIGYLVHWADWMSTYIEKSQVQFS